MLPGFLNPSSAKTASVSPTEPQIKPKNAEGTPEDREKLLGECLELLQAASIERK